MNLLLPYVPSVLKIISSHCATTVPFTSLKVSFMSGNAFHIIAVNCLKSTHEFVKYGVSMTENWLARLQKAEK